MALAQLASDLYPSNFQLGLGTLPEGHEDWGTALGYLYYGADAHAIEIEDRPLAHLRVAILSLLRAGHSVAFTCPRSKDLGGGRESIWITPQTDLRFRFRGSRAPNLNEHWVRAIIATNDSAAGLHLVPECTQSNEPVPDQPAARQSAPPPESKLERRSAHEPQLSKS